MADREAGNTGSILETWSRELADVVERTTTGLVRVNARDRLPATGVVWSQGIVVTADHVIERDENVTITLADGREAPAKIAGRDPRSDLAVLRIEAAATPARIATEVLARVGNLVIAIGTAAGSPQASFGMVSVVEPVSRRAPYGFIRAEVSMLPGFSGGPLVSTSGGVLGINSSHLTRGGHGAIPSAGVQRIADALVAHGQIKRAFLGVSSQQVTLPEALTAQLGRDQRTGLLTIRVEPGSPAEQAGIILGDIIVGIAGQPIRDAEELQANLSTERIGTTTTVAIVRGGELRDVTVTPRERA